MTEYYLFKGNCNYTRISSLNGVCDAPLTPPPTQPTPTAIEY